MTKRDIRVRLPASLADFWKMQAENPGVRLYSGGTDLLVKRREGVVPADADLICLERMPELQRIEDEGREVFIGAGCTHARLLNHPLVKTCFPVLIQGLWVLGSPPIRHMASIGGNICTASPAGDSLPPLYVLAAELELRTENGNRGYPPGVGQCRPRRYPVAENRAGLDRPTADAKDAGSGFSLGGRRRIPH